MCVIISGLKTGNKYLREWDNKWERERTWGNRKQILYISWTIYETQH